MGIHDAFKNIFLKGLDAQVLEIHEKVFKKNTKLIEMLTHAPKPEELN
ncbi:MAG: hypothetical protein OQK82_04280 [Candidatus Pacearchaeota archaeon]|nr:hypothetical protein [Candidatus Pacearchaeota archaeon]